jgi:hypothetical protein
MTVGTAEDTEVKDLNLPVSSETTEGHFSVPHFFVTPSGTQSGMTDKNMEDKKMDEGGMNG